MKRIGHLVGMRGQAAHSTVRRRPRAVFAALAAAAVGALAVPSLASALPTPPFNECPPVGLDTSCGTLIVIQPNGSMVGLSDPSQPPYLTEDTLIGVLNESSSPVKSITLTGSFIFGFDEDGLCTAEPHPSGCPFGPTGYEGPGTSFEVSNFNEGKVLFEGEGLAAGASAYFSLEEAITIVCEEESCKGEKQETTSLSTTLSGGSKSGSSITVPSGTAVSDSATLSGVNASKATGSAEYNVYSDAECSTLVTSAGTVPVSGESVPASNSETLAPGTYYWQARYLGDKANQESKSPCGSEIETVEAAPECTKVEGEVRVSVNKERQTAKDKLSTVLKTKPQVFVFTWSNGAQKAKLLKLTSAKCEEVAPGRKKFSGEGTASLNGVPGYTISFAISTLGNGGNEVAMTLFKGTEKVASYKITAISKEEFS